MTPLSDLKCLVYDYGNYLPIAERLGRLDGFAKVYYYTTKIFNGFPDHRPFDIGRNVPNVEIVKEWASVIDEVDLVVFPDSHEPALQTYFENIGKKVFGSKYACDVEHNRAMAKEMMKEIGLPVNEYEVAHGMNELDAVLSMKENVFVKSKLRGDMETWHHENYLLSKGELLRMRNHMGAYANKEEYIIETPIESLGEIGVDTFCINGRYPMDTLTGIELKDTGYYGQILPYHVLPRQLRNVTDKFSPIFADLKYRGAYSNEIIISPDKQGYLIDSTCRCPQPPTDLAMEIYDNYPEIVWQVANGIVPVIRYTYKHGIQLIVKSDLAKTEPSPLLIPDEYKRFVKVKNLVIDDDGTYYYTPMNLEMCEIASIVGLGNTMYEALDMATKIAESIKGFDIKINTDCIEDAMEQIRNLKKIGINYLS